MNTVPTDPYSILHWNMVHAHNAFKLGHEHLIILLDTPEKFENDLPNFIGYATAWADCIDDHHQTEESVVFPVLEKKISMHSEIEYHQRIHEGLDGIAGYLKTCSTNTKSFDPKRLKTMLVDLKGTLFAHLDEEVEHIAPQELKVFTPEELKGMLDALDAHAKQHGNSNIVLPYMRSHTPPETKEIWPPIPWLLRKVIIPYIFARKHSGYWKYSPYSVS